MCFFTHIHTFYGNQSLNQLARVPLVKHSLWPVPKLITNNDTLRVVPIVCFGKKLTFLMKYNSSLRVTVHYWKKSFACIWLPRICSVWPEGVGPITTPILICVTRPRRETGCLIRPGRVRLSFLFYWVIVVKSHRNAADSLHSSTITISWVTPHSRQMSEDWSRRRSSDLLLFNPGGLIGMFGKFYPWDRSRFVKWKV